ncbi:hypothetical protein K438DRAFT_1775780 [Mycena galopus ATCC 62051]|nr:hypothetical protein K438DRAFT_1775780 [Mycena galopus ATCC 62051]
MFTKKKQAQAVSPKKAPNCRLSPADNDDEIEVVDGPSWWKKGALLQIRHIGTRPWTSSTHNTTISPVFWETVKTFLPKGTKLTANPDLAYFNYTGALSVAQSAVRGLNPGQVTAFEIGNPLHAFAFGEYEAVWEPWSENISQALGFKTPMFQIAATAEDSIWLYDAPGASSALDCVNYTRLAVPYVRDSALTPLSSSTGTSAGQGQEKGGAPPGRIERVYSLGAFAGLWAGTMLMPSEPPYTVLITTPGGRFPPGGFPRDDFIAAARPVYMRIREHWSFAPDTPAPPPPPDSTTADEGLH